ncbi:MAG: hypothetical protein ABI810_19310 [Sphingomonas bacterium]
MSALQIESRSMKWFAPLLLALSYPFLLRGFSSWAGVPGSHPNMSRAAAGWLCLLLAVSVPLVGLAWAYCLRSVADPGDARVRARSLAYLTMVAPPLFVWIGVTRGLVGRPLSDETIWLGAWVAAIAYVALRPPAATLAVSPRLRVVHGVAASLIVLFIGFHLTNHLSGLIGPDMHAAIMKAGRTVYRQPLVEGLLIGLLLFQIATGLALARRWGRLPCDGFRVLQIGSGLYVASFIVTHLNSALIGARVVRHIETDWAWASGAPEGLIHDAWNIRLVPHYGWGVFFVLVHVSLGLRQVVLAHGVARRLVNRLWMGGVVVCGAIALAIMAGLLGLRI